MTDHPTTAAMAEALSLLQSKQGYFAAGVCKSLPCLCAEEVAASRVRWDHPTKEEVEAAGMAVMVEGGCGLTIEGVRVFCDDPRAMNEPTDKCLCRISGRAALLAASRVRSASPSQAIRAEAIEECAKVADHFASSHSAGAMMSMAESFHGERVSNGIAAAIRALASPLPDAGKIK